MSEEYKTPTQIMLYPATKELAREELKIKKNHKWLFLNLDEEITKGIHKFLKMVFGNRVLVINGKKELNFLMGTDELDWRRFVNSTGMDGGKVNLKEMVLNNKGKKTKISFLYTGMDLKEVEKRYEKFIEKLRDMDLKDTGGSKR